MDLKEGFQNLQGLEQALKETLEEIAAVRAAAENKFSKDTSEIWEQVGEVRKHLEGAWNDAGISVPGEVVRVFGFEGGALADIQIDSTGRFITPTGTITKESLGTYILNTVGHPVTRK